MNFCKALRTVTRGWGWVKVEVSMLQSWGVFPDFKCLTFPVLRTVRLTSVDGPG